MSSELEKALAALAESNGSVRFMRNTWSTRPADEVVVFHRGRCRSASLAGTTPAEAIVHLVARLEDEAAKAAVTGG